MRLHVGTVRHNAESYEAGVAMCEPCGGKHVVLEAGERSACGFDAVVVAGVLFVRRSAWIEVRSEGVVTASSVGGRAARSGRVVSGFGVNRVGDVFADEFRRIADGVRRGNVRREWGVRGRQTDLSGADLYRGGQRH